RADLTQDELRDRWDLGRGRQLQTLGWAAAQVAVRSEPAPAPHDHAFRDLDTLAPAGTGHLVKHRTALALAFFESDEQHRSRVVPAQGRDHRADGIADVVGWR